MGLIVYYFDYLVELLLYVILVLWGTAVLSLIGGSILLADAICLKTDNRAIGAIELKLNDHSDMTDRDDECELGYWLGMPFWGQGIMPEAERELMVQLMPEKYKGIEIMMDYRQERVVTLGELTPEWWI